MIKFRIYRLFLIFVFFLSSLTIFPFLNLNIAHAQATGGAATFTVAANDSSARIKSQADYVADGTDDQTEIQSAIDALPATGGQIHLAEGNYNLSSGISVTANKKIKITGTGAILKPAADVTAITVNQGAVMTRGISLEGFTIDGQNNANTKGILLEDTNNSALINIRMVSLAMGLHINSLGDNNFVEGVSLEDILIRDCISGGTGISLTKTGGTGSFAQHQWRHISVANCDMGINLGNGAQVYRSYWNDVTIWVGTNQSALFIDGAVGYSRFEIAVEGSTGSTGNTGISIGANAIDTEHLDLAYSYWGTLATILDNPFNKPLLYKKNRNWFGSANIRPLRIFAYGDTQERIGLSTAFSGGGGFLFGAGGALIPDTNLYRSGAGALKTDGSFTVGNFFTSSNLGIDLTPSDTNPSCSSGNYRIFADSSETKLKKCQDGNITDLDTIGSTAPAVKSGVILNVTEGTPATVNFATAFSSVPFCTVSVNLSGPGTASTGMAFLTASPSASSFSAGWDDATGGAKKVENINWICTNSGNQ